MSESSSNRPEQPVILYVYLRDAGINADAAHHLDKSIETLASKVDTEMKNLAATTKELADAIIRSNKAEIDGLRRDTKAAIDDLRRDTKADISALESRLLWHVLEGVAALLTIAGFVAHLLR